MFDKTIKALLGFPLQVEAEDDAQEWES